MSLPNLRSNLSIRALPNPVRSRTAASATASAARHSFVVVEFSFEWDSTGVFRCRSLGRKCAARCAGLLWGGPPTDAPPDSSRPRETARARLPRRLVRSQASRLVSVKPAVKCNLFLRSCEGAWNVHPPAHFPPSGPSLFWSQRALDTSSSGCFDTSFGGQGAGLYLLARIPYPSPHTPSAVPIVAFVFLDLHHRAGILLAPTTRASPCDDSAKHGQKLRSISCSVDLDRSDSRACRSRALPSRSCVMGLWPPDVPSARLVRVCSGAGSCAVSAHRVRCGGVFQGDPLPAHHPTTPEPRDAPEGAPVGTLGTDAGEEPEVRRNGTSLFWHRSPARCKCFVACVSGCLDRCSGCAFPGLCPVPSPVSADPGRLPVHGFSGIRLGRRGGRICRLTEVVRTLRDCTWPGYWWPSSSVDCASTPALCLAHLPAARAETRKSTHRRRARSHARPVPSPVGSRWRFRRVSISFRRPARSFAR